jgi:hypothetical protein
LGVGWGKFCYIWHVVNCCRDVMLLLASIPAAPAPCIAYARMETDDDKD